MTEKYKLVDTPDKKISIYSSHFLCVCRCLSVSVSVCVCLCLYLCLSVCLKPKINQDKNIICEPEKEGKYKKRLILRFCFYLKNKQKPILPSLRLLPWKCVTFTAAATSNRLSIIRICCRFI